MLCEHDLFYMIAINDLSLLFNKAPCKMLILHNYTVGFLLQ